MSLRRICSLAMLFAILSACSSTSNSNNPTPTYNPFIQLTATPLGNETATPTPTRTPGPTPTRAALSVTLPPTRDPNSPLTTPTADAPHALPTLRQNAAQYTVQTGDTLGSIAQSYGISVNALEQANGISDPNLISVGQTLNVPQPGQGQVGSSFKIIPDSELVYGPASAQFDAAAFIKNAGGYLANYTEAVNDPTLPDVNGKTLTAAQIILEVAQDYSVNPRSSAGSDRISKQVGHRPQSRPGHARLSIGLYPTESCRPLSSTGVDCKRTQSRFLSLE